MSENSPLFVSAIESIAHGIDLYTQGNSKKYKFVILHLANAVELILKDKVIDSGQSIYKENNKQTIGIWESFKALEISGIIIPERPVIELLIDDRNTIQHRFGFPNPESVFYYLQQSLSFFTRFLNDQYGVDLREILLLHTSNENLRIIGLEKDDISELGALDELFKLAPESALIHVWSLLEKRLTPHLSDEGINGKRPLMIWHHKDFKKRLAQLLDAKLVDKNVFDEFTTLREMRGRAAHSQHYEDTPIADWKSALKIGEKLIVAIDKAEKQNLFHIESDEIKKT